MAWMEVFALEIAEDPSFATMETEPRNCTALYLLEVYVGKPGFIISEKNVKLYLVDKEWVSNKKGTLPLSYLLKFWLRKSQVET